LSNAAGFGVRLILTEAGLEPEAVELPAAKA